MSATVVFLAGAAFFLVTPVGLAALVVVVFGPLLAPVLAVARFFVVVVVVSVTVGKTRGLELPRYGLQQSSSRLPAEIYIKRERATECWE